MPSECHQCMELFVWKRSPISWLLRKVRSSIWTDVRDLQQRILSSYIRHSCLMLKYELLSDSVPSSKAFVTYISNAISHWLIEICAVMSFVYALLTLRVCRCPRWCRQTCPTLVCFRPAPTRWHCSPRRLPRQTPSRGSR